MRIAIDFSLIMSNIPLSAEWWKALIAKGLTHVKESDLCDHGFTMDEVNKYLFQLEGPNDQIIKAYFTKVYGAKRLINDNKDRSWYSAINSHCQMWGYCSPMDRMYEIFGLAPVIHELHRIGLNYAQMYTSHGFYTCEQEYAKICKKYNIVSSMTRAYRDTESACWDKIATTDCNVQ